MKNFSADLMALLQSGVPVEQIEMFKIGPCRNGSYIYATTAQVGVTFDGNFYEPSVYGNWQRGTIEQKIGFESNTVDMTVFADNQVPIYFPGTSEGALLIDGIRWGLLGAAKVIIYTAYFSPHVTGYEYGKMTGPTGGSLVETKFVGFAGPVSPIGITKATVGVRDLCYLLNVQIPSRVFQSNCAHVLFDIGCTLSAAAHTKTATVASVSRPFEFASIAHVAPTSSAGTFALGVLKWTSGKNNGLSSLVRKWTSGSGSDTFELDVQPIFPIVVGDTFSVQQGCDHTFASCVDLQGSTNAYINYGGQPNVPVPETAIG